MCVMHALMDAGEATATAPPPGGDGRDDFIGGLPDELLEHILGLLPTAADAIRTSALSRQWRRLWTRVRSLRFHDAQHYHDHDADEPFAAFVGAALAQYGNPAMESLEISLASAGRAHVEAWLRYAMERVVESFRLSMTRNAQCEEPIELPSCGRAAAISLCLGNARLRLPAAAAGVSAFEALTELSLRSVEFSGGCGLGAFVSSCCPRLRKLCVASARGLPGLVLRTAALRELDVRYTAELERLEVVAPELRVLRVRACFARGGGDAVAKVAAPRLEELCWANVRRPEFQRDDMTSVLYLPLQCLLSHGLYPERNANDETIWLLQRCTRAERVGIQLHTPKMENYWLAGLYEDLMEGKLPPLPNIKSMTLSVQSSGHAFGASVACLLARCSGLQELRIHIVVDMLVRMRHDAECPLEDCFCDRPYDWRNQKMSLESLQEVEIRGFTGADFEIDLMKLLLASTTVLRKITINFSDVVLPSEQACEELIGFVSRFRKRASDSRLERMQMKKRAVVRGKKT